MRSSWLSTASAVLVCAAALANSAKLPAPVEQIHYDQSGNLVWSEDADASPAVPSLGRPDFSASASATSLLPLLPPSRPPRTSTPTR